MSHNYPVFSANGQHIGHAKSATQAAEMLSIDAMTWDQSQRSVVATFSNVDNHFAWSDSRLPTASLVPLLKLVPKK